VRTANTLAFALCAMLLPASGGFAQEPTMADLNNPQRVAGDELRQLLTGAKVTQKTRHGSTRHWYNNSDGKFTASSDAVGYKGRTTAYPTTGAGSWQVTPSDQYCVKINWKVVDENWCVVIYKSGDRFYGAARQDDPSARAIEFRFQK